MEKNRGAKVIAIVALLVAVAGLSLGFAAFSNTLTIGAAANVKPNENTFDVDFSSSQSAVETNEIVPKKVGVSTAANGVINNSGAPKITGLSADFTEPGQSVTYEFYAYNNGQYDAFLKSITYGNVALTESTKQCVAGEGTTDSLVQAACKNINVKVNVGDQAATASVAEIKSHSLAKKTSEKVTVTIEYAGEGNRADGDFSVKFGDISLLYSSVDN